MKWDMEKGQVCVYVCIYIYKYVHTLHFYAIQYFLLREHSINNTPWCLPFLWKFHKCYSAPHVIFVIFLTVIEWRRMSKWLRFKQPWHRQSIKQTSIATYKHFNHTEDDSTCCALRLLQQMSGFTGKLGESSSEPFSQLQTITSITEQSYISPKTS